VVTIDTEQAIAVTVVDAIHSGDATRLRQLLAEHPHLAAARLGDDDPDGMSRTLLHVATDWPGHFPSVAEVIGVLIEAGADPDARFRGPHEETPLHWAASSNDVTALDALLDGGADIDAPGAVLGGGTPLADARGFGNREAALRLIERGATVTPDDAAGLGLLDRLLALTAEVQPAQDDLDRWFWQACHGGESGTARHLIERGANPNWIPPWEHLTPLDAACRVGADDLAAWVIAQGGRPAPDQPES
jgi:ankyrin repeat protein